MSKALAHRHAEAIKAFYETLHASLRKVTKGGQPSHPTMCESLSKQHQGAHRRVRLMFIS